MNLNDLLQRGGWDPSKVLVMRHRPHESQLNRVLPWLAAERPDLFNQYQQCQRENVERALPANQELKEFGVLGYSDRKRRIIHFFDFKLTNFYPHWVGKMVIQWPPPERSWWRRAHRNDFSIVAVHEETQLRQEMPDWHDIDLSWEELRVLPTRWKSALKEWRGIYYIFDRVNRKGYVGSAYGKDNILGRWLDYGDRGHGGNRLRSIHTASTIIRCSHRSFPLVALQC